MENDSVAEVKRYLRYFRKRGFRTVFCKLPGSIKVGLAGSVEVAVERWDGVSLASSVLEAVRRLHLALAATEASGPMRLMDYLAMRESDLKSADISKHSEAIEITRDKA